MTAAETEAKEKKDAAAREKQFSDDPIKPEDTETGSALCLGVGFLFFAAATTVSILIIVGAIVDVYDLDAVSVDGTERAHIAIECGTLTNREKETREQGGMPYPHNWDPECLYFPERHAPMLIGTIVGSFCVFVSALFAYQVLDKPEGFEAMKHISTLVREGARTFLHTEYQFIAVFVVAVFVALFFIADWQVAVSYLAGAIVSGTCGYCGMLIAVRANVRTTFACCDINERDENGVLKLDKDGKPIAVPGDQPINRGLNVAFKSGAVMGLSCVGSALFCLSGLLFIFNDAHPLHGFGMGASSIALFARVGGGIFTKAADVGADLVGKVEAGIPEDSPQNPGTIADNVGDNVGDVAGMGSDLFESYCGSIIAAVTLGYSDAAAGCVPLKLMFTAEEMLTVTDAELADLNYQSQPTLAGLQGEPECKFSAKEAIGLPIILASLGIVCSILGIFLVRTNQTVPDMGKLLWSLRTGIFATGILYTGGSVAIILVMGFTWHILVAMECGLIAGILIGIITEYYTSFEYQPTIDVSKAGFTGPATVVIQGFGLGLQSTCAPVLVACASIYTSMRLAGPYGVALSAVGMLATLGITLATDAYGPVADNAGGLAEMLAETEHLAHYLADDIVDSKGVKLSIKAKKVSQLVPEVVRERTDALDALGNTTAAVGKGFAAGSAMLTALALIQSFMQEAAETDRTLDILGNASVVPGLLIGGMLPFLFASMTMLAVSTSAGAIIQEVREQFKEVDEDGRSLVLIGKKQADHTPCIEIATRAAIVEMLMPGCVAVMCPVVMGFLFGPQCIVGVLAGATVSGTMLALVMGNAGGAWDNAKKYVERGDFGEHLSKKSPVHSANVSGDTVGDPFKDTSGPSMDILIKLMAIVSLVLAKPICAETREWWHGLIALGVSLVVVIIILIIRDKLGIKAPDFQKTQYPMDEPIRSKAALVKTLADEILQMQTKQSDMVKGDAGIQIYIETQLKSFEGEGEEKAKAAALNSKCNQMWLPPVAECASTGGTLNAEVWKEASDLLRDDNESNLAKHVQSKLKVKLERP